MGQKTEEISQTKVLRNGWPYGRPT